MATQFITHLVSKLHLFFHVSLCEAVPDAIPGRRSAIVHINVDDHHFHALLCLCCLLRVSQQVLLATPFIGWDSLHLLELLDREGDIDA